MNRKELRDLMDCCRPDRKDLAEPELRALAEALAKPDQDSAVRDEFAAVAAWDRQLKEALQDVPIPDGLAERLLRGVESATGDGTSPAASGSTLREAATEGVELQVTRRTVGRSRRWLVATAAAVAAIAASVLAILAIWPHSDPLTATQVADQARGWITRLDPSAWRDSPPPRDRFPVDPTLRFTAVVWQPVTGVDWGEAVAYQAMLPPDQLPAYLLVIRTARGSQLASLPPLVPDSTTGNLAIGVWKTEQHLYVLMVPGTAAQYRRALRTQALASL